MSLGDTYTGVDIPGKDLSGGAYNQPAPAYGVHYDDLAVDFPRTLIDCSSSTGGASRRIREEVRP